MIDQNKNPKTRALLMEMWSMSNRSAAVSKMMTAFYKRMRDTIEKMIRDVNPRMKDELVRLPHHHADRGTDAHHRPARAEGPQDSGDRARGAGSVRAPRLSARSRRLKRARPGRLAALKRLDEGEKRGAVLFGEFAVAVLRPLPFAAVP